MPKPNCPRPQAAPKECLTLQTPQVAEMLQVSVRTVRGWFAQGRLTGVRVSKRMLLIHRDSVLRFAGQQP
jgi:excisionase family DNA binding protein